MSEDWTVLGFGKGGNTVCSSEAKWFHEFHTRRLAAPLCERCVHFNKDEKRPPTRIARISMFVAVCDECSNEIEQEAAEAVRDWAEANEGG